MYFALLRNTRLIMGALLLIGMAATAQANDGQQWLDDLRAAQRELRDMPRNERAEAVVAVWQRLEYAYPVYMDWLLQDGFEEPLWTASPAGGREGFRVQSALIGPKLAALIINMDAAYWHDMLSRVKASLAAQEIPLPDELSQRQVTADGLPLPELVNLYLDMGAWRREQRLVPLLAQQWDGIVFAQHFNMGASHYAYTEGLSDAQNERHFYPGSALRLLRFEGEHFTVETLLEDADGVIRDVDVSWDGQKILFAWKKSDREDDYSLYEMDVASNDIRAISGDLGHADYEPVYLPNGDILFNSTRCVQIVDCWWTEVSNLYVCAADGQYMRRLTFDQVHTNYPTVTQDGRIVYTRWDYNDRGQLYPQGLFEMFPDGTAQREYYGNNSWFPTTILHARDIPGTEKMLAIFTGHHSWQAGKVGVLNPALGRQENEGAQLVAPVRSTPAERIDRYGQEGDLFKYPYPVDATHFLVSYAPRGWEGRGGANKIWRPVFGLYFMDMDGNQELLYLDAEQELPVGRMVPLTPRTPPVERPSMVDYRKDTGMFYIQDIYAGEGLEDVPRGAIKSLRVVALEYRAAGIGSNRNEGVAGNALVSTPISISNGSWDVKVPLGRANVYEDGSAFFTVPARTPVYFQALDADGHAVQSMRSWATLQPGETLSCVGCHDNKNTSPPAHATPTQAMTAGASALDETYGAPRGFSFPERIQPILDRHCVSCHYGDEPANDSASDATAFSLLATSHKDEGAKRYWSEAYLRLTEGGPDEGPARWMSPQSAPPMYPPYYTGATRSPLITLLASGHNEVTLSEEEMRTLACWIDLAVPFCGDYAEANAWNDDEKAKHEHFMQKRRTMEAREEENIQAYIQARQ